MQPFLRALRGLAAASALVALYALWSAERVQLDCDLQLAAPPEARPGETVALRALAFCDLEAPAGPRLATPPSVDVKLLDRAGRTIDEGRPLAASKLETFDGAIALPAREGDWLLEATTIVDELPLSVRRPIRARPDAKPERVVGREAGPLQQYALGRVRALEGAAPDRMLPRVVGGACVPEQVCTMIFWVGTPAASIALRAPAEVTVRSRSTIAETDGFVQFELLVHGPEAELTFEARRAGALVADRALRLPIALGEPALLGGPSIVELPEQPVQIHFAPREQLAEHAYAVAFPPGRSLLSRDAFASGRWSRTSAISVGGMRKMMPTADPSRDWIWPLHLFDNPLQAGLHRVQVRADRFSSEAAGTRLVFAAPARTPPGQALTEIARTLETPEYRAWLSPQDEPGPRTSALWAEQLPAFALEDVQVSAAFLLAPAEATRALVPLPSSGRPAQLARLTRTKVRMRYGVAGALALSAWLIALSIARRGLLAVDQAHAILREARHDEGEDEAQQHGAKAARERISARAKVLLMVLAVALAFLAGALLIAAKSLWF